MSSDHFNTTTLEDSAIKDLFLVKGISFFKNLLSFVVHHFSMYLQYMNCFLKLCLPVNLTQFLLNMFVSGCISTNFSSNVCGCKLE